jgi:hypothetical protein
MNFKPTITKTILSILFGLFAGYLALTKGIEFFLALIVITLLIYSIWSLFQKKKKH